MRQAIPATWLASGPRRTARPNHSGAGGSGGSHCGPWSKGRLLRMGRGRLEVNRRASPVGVRLGSEWPCARIEGRVRGGVRLAFRAHTRRLMLRGPWPEFLRAGPGSTPSWPATDGVLGPLLGLPPGPSWPARPGQECGPGLHLARQLPGARAVAASRHPRRGSATPGSRRRQHVEIIDGDAGRTAALLHLSRSAASKLTILLLKRCPVRAGVRFSSRTHSFCLAPAWPSSAGSSKRNRHPADRSAWNPAFRRRTRRWPGA
jgi:hypothetical protein